MTIIACLEAVALVAVVVLFLRSRASSDAQTAIERESWAAERRELLNRVQRPEILPLVPADFKVPEPSEQDDSHLVGAVLEEPVE